ncbi:MAG: hydroxymethylglutaryl-CoA lyase [Dongiaceae bacterium]
MTQPKFVKIVEVSARDGLQNEKKILPVAIRVELVNRLSETGLLAVEAGAFVSPKWVPQMAGSDEVFRQIVKRPGVSYPCLVPNDQGLDAALAAGVKEIAVFLAASETFSQKNINCTIAESFVRNKPVIARALRAGMKVRGYVSCVLGCPYEGAIKPEAVYSVAHWLLTQGCYEVSLGDTIGAGAPDSTKTLLDRFIPHIPGGNLAIHCHDTHNRAIDNIEAALDYGIGTVDSSVAGLGGCPFAPGAKGNVATEKVLALLNRQKITYGIDAARLAQIGPWIRGELSR